jgi:hypothetical protein
MIRVDEETGRQLDLLMQTFERPAAEIIRHLITQATLADFPSSWPVTSEERRPREAPPGEGKRSSGRP